MVADSMLKLVERSLGVDLRGATEVLSISTPLTNARFAGTVGGALYGSQPLPFDATVFRVPHQGPLDIQLVEPGHILGIRRGTHIHHHLDPGRLEQVNKYLARVVGVADCID